MKKLLVLLLVCGCDNTTQSIQPLPPVTSEAGVPSPAAPRRTVGYRNPFGDALQSDNLMVDGDFELTGRTDQAPWIDYAMQTQQVLNYDTGGRCRSGVRCAVMGTTDALIGFMSSPVVDTMVVRVYVLPDSGTCSDASVVAVDINGSATGGTVPPPSAPGPDGWCVFEGTSQNLAYDQPALYITMSSKAKSMQLHVDDATVLPASEVPVHGVRAMTRPTDELMARANEATTWIRTHRRYGRPAERTAP
jgi:hypothetical protein